MYRFVNIAGGVALAGFLSQFPEFSQRYVQRLGGAVDELHAVVRDFYVSAEATGQNRATALKSSAGTDFLARGHGDMRRAFERQQRIENDYLYLRDANVYLRLAYIAKQPDRTIAGQVWDDFKPAVPLTLDGLALTLVGYLSGYGAFGGLFALLRRWRFRRPA